MTPLSVTSVGRDGCGQWAWMLATPRGDLIESDWGYASHEGATEAARQAARRYVRSFRTKQVAA